MQLTLILTLLGVFAPDVFAGYKVVDYGQVVTESGTTYDDGDGYMGAALTVTDDGFYSGTNITLNATGYWAGALVLFSGSLSLTDSTINLISSPLGVYAQEGCTITLDHVNITGAGLGIGILSESTATLTNININTTGVDTGSLFLDIDSSVTVYLNGNTLTNDANSIFVNAASTLTLTGSNGSVITGDITASNGDYGASTVTLTLTGEGTALHGDLIKEDSTITITLSAGALLDGAGEVSNLTLNPGAILGYTDGLTVTDTITIGAGITIDFSSLTETDNYLVLDWTGASISGGSISDDQFTATNAEGTFSVQGAQLYFNATAVPEPSTWFLLGAGLGALALTTRRRRS
jgi:hypothetical protein